MPTDDELNAAHNLSKAIHERIRGHRGLESTVRVKALHEFLPPSPGLPGSAQSTKWELSQKGMLYEQTDVRIDMSLSMAQAYTKVVDKAICGAAAMTPNSVEGDVGESFYSAHLVIGTNGGSPDVAAFHGHAYAKMQNHLRGDGYRYTPGRMGLNDIYRVLGCNGIDIACTTADPPVMYARRGLLFVYETVQHRIAREQDEWERNTGVAPGPDLLDRWAMMGQSPATSPVWVMAEWDIMRKLWRFAAYASIAAALVEPGLVVRMDVQ